MWRVVATIERIGFASSLAYLEAAPHYRQWQKNNQMLPTVAVRMSVPID
jgi:hypothetical protein